MTTETEKERLCRLGRMLRAIELGLDPNTPWSEISAAYKNYPQEMGVTPVEDASEEWPHPLSGGEMACGKRITEDLTVLTAGDLYASSDGTWKHCPVPGVLFRSWSGTIWIRP